MTTPPLDAVVSDSADSLNRDFGALLRGLGLVPASTQVLDEKRVIQAVQTNATKYWSAIAAASGGALSLANIIAAWRASEEPTKLALIGGAAVTLAATIIGVSLIVRSDLVARAGLTQTLFDVRSKVAAAVLLAPRQAATSTTPVAAAASPVRTASLAELLSHVAVTVPGQDPSPGLYGVRRDAAGQPIQILRGDGTWAPLQGHPLADLAFSFEVPPPA